MHCHSNFSDGVFSPKTLLEQEEKEELIIFSITDHDALEGTKIAYELASEFSFLYLTGIELSAKHKGLKTEILGYNLDTNKSKISKKLKFVQEARKRRILKILNKLSDIGLKLSIEDINNQVGAGSSPGRPHFARALIGKNYVQSVDEAFRMYLGEGKPGYVPREKFEPKEAIELIHAVNGIAVLPHPLLIEIENFIKLEDYLDTLLSWGLDGIEIFYNYEHVSPSIPEKRRKEGTEMLRKYCKKNDLLITGGSDFHGDKVRLGEVYVPERIIESLLSYFKV